MDIFSMLQNAVIVDVHTGEVVAQSVGFQVLNGRMKISVVSFQEDEDEWEDGDDDDDGEEIPDDDASKQENIVSLVSERTGTNDG